MDESLDRTGPASPRRFGALKLLAVLLILAIVALLVWATLASSRGQGFVQQIANGKRPAAPAFDLPVIWKETGTWPAVVRGKIDDGKLSLADLRGQVVVVNFYASWCVTCRDEAPYLRRAAARYAGRVVFVGLDVQDLATDGIRFARHWRFNYGAIRDRDGRVYRAFGLTGVPETFYLDRRGRAVAHSPGGVETEGLERGIAAALASH